MGHTPRLAEKIAEPSKPSPVSNVSNSWSVTNKLLTDNGQGYRHLPSRVKRPGLISTLRVKPVSGVRFPCALIVT